MQIHSVTNTDANVNAAEPRGATRAAPASVETAKVAPLGEARFARALDAAADTRTEAIARGRELFQEVPYPPTEIVNGISRLIARSWKNAP